MDQQYNGESAEVHRPVPYLPGGFDHQSQGGALTAACGFCFMNADDDGRLLEGAQDARFSSGEVILGENSATDAMFLIVDGYARIESTRVGSGIGIARRGPGDLVGEMSFLGRQAACASVVADTDVQVLVVSRHHHIRSLAADPEFAPRFYEALAMSISHRLRELTPQLPVFMVEQVAQVAALGQGMPQPFGDVPASLIEQVEDFKATLWDPDGGLKDRSQDELRSLFAKSRIGGPVLRFELEPAGVDLIAFCKKEGV